MRTNVYAVYARGCSLSVASQVAIQYILLNSPPSGSGGWPGLLEVLDY